MDWRMVLCVFSLVLTVHGGVGVLPSAVERANATIRGLFRYYWSSDPKIKDIMFFFACGQIGGGGGYQWNKCGCTTPASCLACYRWWDAVALESVATFGIYTGSKEYATTPDHIFDHSPYNAKWNAATACTFMDDFTWYGIAYLRVYEWLKVIATLNFHCYIYNNYYFYALLLVGSKMVAKICCIV